jgi:hypothetical protein
MIKALILKMTAVRISETLVFFNMTTSRNIPQGWRLYHRSVRNRNPTSGTTLATTAADVAAPLKVPSAIL